MPSRKEKRRRKMKCTAYQLYPILLLVLAMVLGACQMVTPTALPEAPAAVPAGTEGEPSAPAAELTLETLAGLWQMQHAGFYLEVDVDGVYKVWNGLPRPGGFPKEAGHLELDGALLTFHSTDEGLLCRNQSGTYEVTEWSRDEFYYALVEDECPGRREGNASGRWERVSETDG
jgi:hypothetical protein